MKNNHFIIMVLLFSAIIEFIITIVAIHNSVVLLSSENTKDNTSDSLNKESALDSFESPELYSDTKPGKPEKERTKESFESETKTYELDKLTKAQNDLNGLPDRLPFERVSLYPLEDLSQAKGIFYELRDSYGNVFRPLRIEEHGIYTKGNIFIDDGLELNTSLRFINAKLNYMEQRLKLCEER